MTVTASRPFPHSPITSTSGACLIRIRIPSRASGSSSTIKARIFSNSLPIGFNLDLRFSMEWKLCDYDQTAFLGVAHIEAALGAIQISEPGARVRKADPLDQFFARDALTRAVVAYFETHHSVSALGSNLDDSSCLALGDAVPDGVFNQRLKKELRRQRV